MTLFAVGIALFGGGAYYCYNWVRSKIGPMEDPGVPLFEFVDTANNELVFINPHADMTLEAIEDDPPLEE